MAAILPVSSDFSSLAYLDYLFSAFSSPAAFMKALSDMLSFMQSLNNIHAIAENQGNGAIAK
jgi:hypothetical protein